jgi:hypothetical protein
MPIGIGPLAYLHQRVLKRLVIWLGNDSLGTEPRVGIFVHREWKTIRSSVS